MIPFDIFECRKSFLSFSETPLAVGLRQRMLLSGGALLHANMLQPDLPEPPHRCLESALLRELGGQWDLVLGSLRPGQAGLDVGVQKDSAGARTVWPSRLLRTQLPSTHTHTCTHNHTYTYVWVQIHIGICAYTHNALTCMYTHAHAHTYTNSA